MLSCNICTLILLASSAGFSFSFSRFARVKVPQTLIKMSETDIPSRNNEKIKFANDVSKAIGIGSIILTFALPKAAKAGFFQSKQQDLIDEVASYRKPIYDLYEQLTPTVLPNAIGVFSKTQTLKGTKEDSYVVVNYLVNYIKPLQQKMKDAAPLLSLDEKSQERLLILPSLMIGHILELQQEISTLSVEGQAREVKEVLETLAEFLTLASSKYNVPPFDPTHTLTDAEFYGPLGCEFWGKKRVEGSNACI